LRVVTRTRRGARFGGHVAAIDDRDDQTRADRAEIDLLDEALQLDDADMVKHRRLDPRNAQAGRQKAGAQPRFADQHPAGQRPRPADPGERGQPRRRQRRKPQHRLAASGEIERHAGHRGDRNPEEEAPFLDLARQCAGEDRPPVRRPSKTAPRRGGGEDMRARPGRHGRRRKHGA
jgi:hypothetical protein